LHVTILVRGDEVAVRLLPNRKIKLTANQVFLLMNYLSGCAVTVNLAALCLCGRAKTVPTTVAHAKVKAGTALYACSLPLDPF
jgi:hypothetical protein